MEDQEKKEPTKRDRLLQEKRQLEEEIRNFGQRVSESDINVVGKTIKVLLPIEIAGVVNEYVFCFTIGWKFTYPEYQD